MGKKNPPSVVRENIEVVATMEQQFLEGRSSVERGVDAIAGFVGSLLFVLLHLLVFAFWILANLGLVPFVPRFDPFPYTLLGTALSAEAVVLSTLVLMKQNRMAKRADHREHLHLQINLLAEKEITKVLQTVGSISQHLGIRQDGIDHEMNEMSQNHCGERSRRGVARKDWKRY